MNNEPEMDVGESVMWSAIINGHHVRLVVAGAGSAWRCDCTDAAPVDANGVATCEHIRFGFDVWFGREPHEDAIVTDVVEW
jgi:hypothetical protein